MEVISEKEAMRQWSRKQHCQGRTVALVPTMGYLHEGHLSLVRLAASLADVVAVSIYVNPSQFAPHEDLLSYPRDLARDLALLKLISCSPCSSPAHPRNFTFLKLRPPNPMLPPLSFHSTPIRCNWMRAGGAIGSQFPSLPMLSTLTQARGTPSFPHSCSLLCWWSSSPVRTPHPLDVLLTLPFQLPPTPQDLPVAAVFAPADLYLRPLYAPPDQRHAVAEPPTAAVPGPGGAADCPAVASAAAPAGHETWVTVERLQRPLCGGGRPVFFRGVATVVVKLLHIVEPDVAVFGKKDYQQWRLIQRMVRDLDMAVQVVGAPVLREVDGLAMSSRNVRLTPQHRQQHVTHPLTPFLRHPPSSSTIPVLLDGPTACLSPPPCHAAYPRRPAMPIPATLPCLSPPPCHAAYPRRPAMPIPAALPCLSPPPCHAAYPRRPAMPIPAALPCLSPPPCHAYPRRPAMPIPAALPCLSPPPCHAACLCGPAMRPVCVALPCGLSALSISRALLAAKAAVEAAHSGAGESERGEGHAQAADASAVVERVRQTVEEAGGRVEYVQVGMGWDGDEAAWDGDEAAWDGDEAAWDGDEAAWDGDEAAWDGDGDVCVCCLLVEQEGLEPVSHITCPAVLAVAAHFGSVRLIDNVEIDVHA
ncbi:unnamed protein product [Closterium sp. NIES-65]|nr:unnamed protein product [Closterium sp. NIES-65]